MVKEEGEEGEGVDDPAKHWWWWLPLPRKLGGQLPAGCGGLLLWHRGVGDACQELGARLESMSMLKVKVQLEMRPEAEASQWTCLSLLKK